MDPKKCVVIGDGYSDIIGGLRASMKVIFLSKEPVPQETVQNLFNGTLIAFSKGDEVSKFVEDGCLFPREYHT
jgi:beta-phosphoglucomutase-like phosphatase (HAD superfamily)